MRFLKAIVIAVLIYIACFMIILVAAQIITGYDFTAAYTAVGSVGVVELALSSIIKRQEKKLENNIKKENKKDD